VRYNPLRPGANLRNRAHILLAYPSLDDLMCS
jgi:hypothetical protein